MQLGAGAPPAPSDGTWRSLAALREHGLIADFYGDDARYVPDETWIAEGCRRGWVLLSKDKRIRRCRSQELSELDGYLFATIAETAQRFIIALPAIVRAVGRGDRGFWHFYASGKIAKMWP